jgi:DoxX-like family
VSGPPIYVETVIRTSVERLWERTQVPALHQRWDLRFTEIRYLPRPDESQPQRFGYETRIGFGLRIAGEGETVGTREDAAGMRTSALTFWSDDPKSLIRTGSGYWQYVPVEGGVRFLTRYDYEVRFGPAGRLVDRLVFRPLIGWATAWSFDRLRLWIEEDVDPAVSLERSLVHAIARVTLGGLWLYQGIVPKLLFTDSGEREILRRAGLPGGLERPMLAAAGLAEVIIGALTLLRWHERWPLWATLLLMPTLLSAVARSQASILTRPFNPVSLNGAMAALAGIGLLAGRCLPSAGRCRRSPGTRSEAEA